MKDIAVLITCYNRKQKTISCLDRLFKAKLPNEYKFETFLVDDGSIDGTADAVKDKFPTVNIIKGNGNLFWNGGMRLAWDTASKAKDFDFYLWLNDDTLLDEFAIEELLDCYVASKQKTLNESIIVGACRESNELKNFSYGGRDYNEKPIIPNGCLQQCKLINGNVVLIPKDIYLQLGNLSSDYTHAIGDSDYGLRATNEGFHCYTTTRFIAVCPNNETSKWSDPSTPLLERIKLLYSPKGLNLKEYIIFRKKFWGWKWIIFYIKAYAKTLFPSRYQIFKTKKR